jgi:hypothetical protein
LKNNISFYSILSCSFIIIIFNIIFFCYSITKIKRLLFKELPTKEKIKIDATKRLLEQKKSNKNIILEPIKRERKIKKRKKVKKVKKAYSLSQSSFIKFPEKKASKYFDNKEEDINQLSYERAKHKDKRSFVKTFISIIIQKIDLIDIFLSKNNLQLILISQYLTLLMINIFFNTLLYSNEIISKKYHNNGELDFLVTLILTLLSNIITSIISFYLNYPKGIEDRIELIKEIKNEYYYIFNITKLIKYIKIKFIIFFICEIIILFICLYYISIFFIVYSFCKINLIINYITSSLESLLVSFIISIIIVLLRKIGLVYLNKNIYNVSKYLNEKF